MKCVINKLAPHASFLCIMDIFIVGFLQLTSGAAGVAGFLEGVKNAVTGFNNVLKLI